ncbi:type II toxin-antitoxin system PemK/MazF family toxin [Phragmitibacter flavus]|uniref:Type II toxin-antitoxin system PemK/MazF family toxin n=1 Tax=Phragmitibacter flavus TaxID=2576071 RepID=A0A5R8KA46_9BACT|nr:type II toxin-antitoxin system PemK/MazF family toxin [Phragmitibacter flavus]TLD69166.1 type II toxin-antitoxin system PemK/MazF family toxin [Phragmitibacter flavus]
MKTEPGQVYRVDLGYSGKMRMMAVVSMSDEDAPRALTICIPITTAYRNSWYEIALTKKTFLRETSYANVQGIQAIQNHELQGPIGKLTAAEMTNIRAALAKMFEIQ